jgi:hypothetical protein
MEYQKPELMFVEVGRIKVFYRGGELLLRPISQL